MPKVANELTALDVKRLSHPGGGRNVLCAVGGVPGLHLQITPNGGRSWVLRAKVGTMRRDISLNSLNALRTKQTAFGALVSQDIQPGNNS